MKKTRVPQTPTQEPLEVRLGEARARIAELEKRNERLEEQRRAYERFLEAGLRLVGTAMLANQ